MVVGLAGDTGSPEAGRMIIEPVEPNIVGRPCERVLRAGPNICLDMDVPDVRRERPHAPRWRWTMLCILSLDICVSYLPYYTFVPILRQATQVYSVDEAALNNLCILYALVFVPGAFITGPVVGRLGCRVTFCAAMCLITAGCVLRCGRGLLGELLPMLLWVVDLQHTDGASMDFTWLLVGQALCASGQLFLVNSTSEMGAEWFPAHERPTAALVSNLMNFLGGSLSFMMPTAIVEDQDKLQVAEHQLARLLRLQLLVSAGALWVTFFLYQPAPHARSRFAAKREPVPFISEVRGVLALRDFWLLNGYFTVYVTLCHAFDAMEGTLLEHYGYSAALSSWTGLSCAFASILISLVESWYIVDAGAYRPVLAVSSLLMAASLLTLFACLHWQLHSSVFIAAVGVMGLSVPAWGCSFELGSEICFPAREATVSSILEAFSNLMGVVGIMSTQHLIDQGMGASVLIIMALASAVGGCLLIGTSGRLRRSEAEAVAVSEVEMNPVGVCPAGGTTVVGPGLAAGPEGWRAGGQGLPEGRHLGLRKAAGSALSMLLICQLLLIVPQTQLPEELMHPFTEVSASEAQQRAARGKEMPFDGLLANGLPEPKNIVIHCTKDKARMKRFTKHMKQAGLKFTVAPCAVGSLKNVTDAVRDGLLPRSAQKATSGRTRLGLPRATLIGTAIAHLRLLKAVAESRSSQPLVANILEDTEVVHTVFRTRRNQLLGLLPQSMDLAKLSVLRPAGVKLHMRNMSHWMHGRVFRIRPRTSPLTNLRLSNYVVTRQGAQKLLQIGRKYDTFGSWEIFDIFLLEHLFGRRGRVGFQGFTVETDVLSTHCEELGMCYRVAGRGGLHTQGLARCHRNRSLARACRES